jgi:hypothetical protein
MGEEVEISDQNFERQQKTTFEESMCNAVL